VYRIAISSASEEKVPDKTGVAGTGAADRVGLVRLVLACFAAEPPVIRRARVALANCDVWKDVRLALGAQNAAGEREFERADEGEV
jgi:hypothetical protein